MKHILIAAGFLLCIYNNSLACDVCGCSVGGNYFGILPQFRSHFVGLRYQYRAFDSKHPAVFGHEATASSSEYFHTAELWGRWALRPNLQLFGFVPYHHFAREEGSSVQSARGLGDIALSVNWVVWNTSDSSARVWKQALQIGGGIKLPLGSTTVAQDGALLLRNMQPGTGSFDFPLHAMYVVRHNRSGLSAEVNYRIQTSDFKGYQFGDRVNVNVRAFHWKQMRSSALLPSFGLMWEVAAADQLNRFRQDLTGGESLWASAGIDAFLPGFSVSVLYQHPIRSHVGAGYIDPKPRISAGGTLFF